VTNHEEISDQVVGIRLPRKDVLRLDTLCRQSYRKRAEVVRLLLSQADWQGSPDILLSPIPRIPEPPVEQTSAVEARSDA
jgi:hypothetical protein